MLRRSLYDECLEHGKPNLLQEWDAEKNAPLTPQSVCHRRRKKVWRRCGKGHQWQSAVYTRTGTGGQGCPYCAGRRVLKGFNDLTTLEPALAAQWHPPLNGTLTAE